MVAEAVLTSGATVSLVVSFGAGSAAGAGPHLLLQQQGRGGVLRRAAAAAAVAVLLLLPMFIMLGSFVVFRQIYLYVMANFISNEIVPIALSYPAGWFVCSAATLLYYTHCKFDHYRLVEDV